jgi:DNA-binding MarR family transcriptional regulator
VVVAYAAGRRPDLSRAQATLRRHAEKWFVSYTNYVSESAPRDEPPMDRALASRLRLSVVRLNRRLRAQRASSTVSLTQLAALSTLWKCGPLTPGELAAREGVQPPSMTRVIAALEEYGFVSRRPHPTDGRQAIVELTDTGRAYHDAEVSIREAWLDRRLAALDDEERALLSRAAEIIERMAGSSE